MLMLKCLGTIIRDCERRRECIGCDYDCESLFNTLADWALFLITDGGFCLLS